VLFRDRRDAGQRLAEHVAPLRLVRPLVLALPRGGVPVGFEIARRLDAPLDVFVARKLGAPGRPELGIGAIAEGGARVVDSQAVRGLGVSPAALEALVASERAELERRVRAYRGDRPIPPLTRRDVVLVDDGLATGVTARAAILALRYLGPHRLVLAVPVAAPERAEALAADGVEVVCPSRPLGFRAVGSWYEHFEQTSDEEVVELLATAAADVERISPLGPPPG
jgi:putative phosphoribosyl transferase